MTTDQILLFLLTGGVLVFLVWGRFRYDLVAFGALAIGAVAGLIPNDQVFSGFGHPAVVIIALVLIVSRGLSRSGAIELLARKLLSASHGLRTHIGLMGGISAVLSTIMNNVAALALLMPIDIQAARRAKRSPAVTLMPLSFASILGGMVTLIGTPPNIVIATFREDALGEPYSMFDFSPVGIAVSLAGVLFVTLIGWRLIPVDRSRRDTGQELSELIDFIYEARLTEGSDLVGQTLESLFPVAEDCEVNVLGLVRRGQRVRGSSSGEELKKSDLIVLEGTPEAIERLFGQTDLDYATNRDEEKPGVRSVVEVVVPAGSRIVGRSAMDVRLLYRHGAALIGVSRKGKRTYQRLRRLKIEAGDILLLQGQEGDLETTVQWLGALPLAGRGIEFVQRSKAWKAISIFAVAIVAASTGIVYLPVALAAAVVAYVVLDVIPLSELFDAVEWPVIVLLASMIPIGAALEASGGTALIAQTIVSWTGGLPTVAVLVILMVITMTLSDILNNVATALIAAPIAIDIAAQLNANPDAFLMGVAVAASCAFLTPIGHKNNTLILGPGGYRFGDFWRMGLPLEILVLVVSVPAILVFWPL
ncbi:MAG: SLC13 family permease [Pseudomonadota bacterium]